MYALFLTVLLGACTPAKDAAKSEAVPETVVLLHGMGRTRLSLWVLEKRLQRAGFRTLNFPYSARNETLDELSDALHAFVEKNVQTPRYHFVAHSLGNIIIRNGFKKPYRAGLGRIVMLAPPNHPADLAKRLKDNPVYEWVHSDSGQKLASPEFYRDLPAPPVEFGVIAGDRGQQLTFDEPNDGIVTVAGTKLEGMKDWLLLHHTHTFMMNSRDTAEQCVHFLKHGMFRRDTAAKP